MNFQNYTLNNLHKITQIAKLSSREREAIYTVGQVLPFKTNNYVVNELINWDNFQYDPMFILNFPQKEMLSPKNYRQMNEMVQAGASVSQIKRIANEIRLSLNPHPAGQREYNMPVLNGVKLNGIQHKYKETVLFFPTQGQTCHAYCTFCFRWPQFTGMQDLRFAMKQGDLLAEYVKQNVEVTDILFTGGDPMVMSAKNLAGYFDALLKAKIPNLKTIRIGTKSLAYWPYRFLTDKDSTELIDLFKRLVDSGIHLAFMGHFNHYKELETDAVKEAIARIRSTGAQIRTQSPILNHINASPRVWERMWRKQVELGLIPYYMFVARNTGAQHYFAVPLSRSYQIFREAYSNVSGICRTVRGPSMSTNPGKVHIVGISEVDGQQVFVLNFIQARNTRWIGRPFFAKYDEHAIWLSDLKPAFGEEQFFFENDNTEQVNVPIDNFEICSPYFEPSNFN